MVEIWNVYKCTITEVKKFMIEQVYQTNFHSVQHYRTQTFIEGPSLVSADRKAAEWVCITGLCDNLHLRYKAFSFSYQMVHLLNELGACMILSSSTTHAPELLLPLSYGINCHGYPFIGMCIKVNGTFREMSRGYHKTNPFKSFWR